MFDPITVLFVDDDPVILRLLRRVLRDESFEIITAGSAAEALDRLDARRVDVLVTDLEMPEMDGVQLLQLARLLHPGTLRVLMTGTPTVERLYDAINTGEVVRCVAKPFDVEALRATLASLSETIERARRDEVALREGAERERLFDRLEARFPGLTALPRDDDGGVCIDVAERLTAADASGSRVRAELFRGA